MSHRNFHLFLLCISFVFFQNCDRATYTIENEEFLNSGNEILSVGEGEAREISEHLGQDPVFQNSTPSHLLDPVDFSECERFQEITGEVFILPDRASTTICFYKKLIDSTQPHPSGSFGESRVTDVIASDHGGESGAAIAPYLLEEGKLNYSNFPGWKMAFSETFSDPATVLAVDNFFLMELNYGDQPPIESVTLFGTADAEPGSGAAPILYRGKEITEFTALAPSGTAYVEALNLTPVFQEVDLYRDEYALRLRALDCGGSARTTNVYLVFH